MNSIIRSAIRSHNMIRFYYDGGYRTAEPFCHGASRAGNDLLRAYQTADTVNPVIPIWELPIIKSIVLQID